MSNLRQLLSLLFVFCCACMSHAANERIFRAITASNGLADNSAQTIKCTKTGRMTITTLGNINFYDGSKFYHINSAQEDKYKLDAYRGNYHLYYDNIHHLWLKDTHSVTCVNLTTERFVSNMDSLFHSMGVSSKVNDIFVDSEGNVWLVSYGKLWSVTHKKTLPIHEHLNLQDLEVYENNLLMLFYEDGSLATYNIATGEKIYENRAYDLSEAGHYDRTSVLYLNDKELFQIRNGQNGGILLRYDITRRSWQTLMQSEQNLNNMAVSDGVLYVAAHQGYFTYNLDSGEILQYPTLMLWGGRELVTDVNDIEFDRQGGMWVGTEKRGLLYARPQNAPFTRLAVDNPLAQHYIELMRDRTGITEFNGRRANVLLIDSRRWTWVGTAEGLFLYKSPQAEPVLLTRSSGLLNNVIHALVEDEYSNVWVATSYGISCIQIDRGDVHYVTSFNEEDNVPAETFIDGKVLRLEDGSIVMQAIDNVVVFNPAEFKTLLAQEPFQMFPKLTSLLVNGSFVTVGTEVNGSVILEKAITRTKEINLNYDQNSISLTFSALNYGRPLQTFYRLRIKELDEEWQVYSYFKGGGFVDSRGLLHLPMIGLKPGTYHIELQASNVPDKWMGDPFVWVINVNEPWWRTTAIFLVLGTLLLGLLLVNFFLYNRNTRMRVRRNTNEGDMLSRIQNFVERYNTLDKEFIGPTQDEITGAKINVAAELSPEFVEMMALILPHVNNAKSKRFSVHNLVDLAGVDVTTFYQVVSSNLYKSPRLLVLRMRLEKARQLLEKTSMTIEEISTECHFLTPNFFIACFYHRYKVTPRDYRLTI